MPETRGSAGSLRLLRLYAYRCHVTESTYFPSAESRFHENLGDSVTLAGSVRLRVRRRRAESAAGGLWSPSRTRTGTGNLIRAPRGRQMVAPTRSRAGAEVSRRRASSQSHSTLAVSGELPGPGRARRLHHRYASCTRCVQAQTQCSMAESILPVTG
jgi:hypothetical protein